MKKILSYFVFVLIVSANYNLKAQQIPVKKSEHIETINGEKYYIHIIQEHQTLYSISKTYSVPIEDIIKANPEAKEVIHPNQKLKIPVKKIKNTEYVNKQENIDNTEKELKEKNKIPEQKKSDKAESDTTKNKKKFIYYTVKKKDNLYRISKKYSVGIDEIRVANPDLGENLITGQIIKVPLKEKYKKGIISAIFKGKSKEKITKEPEIKKDTSKVIEKIPEYSCDAPILDSVYNVALMLPFYLDDINEIKVDDEFEIKNPLNYKSFTFIQFYEGVLMAVDSLKKQGLSVRLYVYDIDEDSMSIKKLLRDSSFKDINLIISDKDLIIGPVFRKNLELIAEFAKKYNINIVSPLSSSDGVLKENPHAFKIIPSKYTKSKELAKFIVNKYKEDNIIIVSNTKENSKISEIFNKDLSQTLKNIDTLNNFKYVFFDKIGINGFKKIMSKEKNNILITLSDNQAFISNYVRELDKIREKNDYKITLFGMDTWVLFNRIEIEYFQNLDLHLFSCCFIDYDDNNVKNFIFHYRSIYKTEPDKYAFMGFDIAYYFLNALMKYGKNFDKCISNTELSHYPGTQTVFEFKKYDNNGFENTYLNIYKYEDYKLIDIRKDISKTKGL